MSIRLKSCRHVLRARAILLASSALVGASLPVRAQDAGWLAAPVDANFTNAANWNLAAVPTGTATFGATNISTILFDNNVSIGGFTLSANAPAYTFNNPAFNSVRFINGAGVVINGGSAAFNNANGGNLVFDSASAGGSSITNNGAVFFLNNATAGTSQITNRNSAALWFSGTSTAGGATIANNDIAGAAFHGSSTAGSAAITNSDSSALFFFDSSSAGSAVIVNKDATAEVFENNSTAGNATITNQNNAALVFSNTSTAGSSIVANKDGATASFHDSSTAGSAAITNSDSSTLFFFDSSSAGSAVIVTKNATTTAFENNSTAGNGAITANDTAAIVFQDSATAGNANLIVNGSGVAAFVGAASAGNSTVTLNGANASAVLFSHASGGTARFILNGGFLDISNLATPGTTVGSIESNGQVYLGDFNLAVGGNNLSTTFSGVLQDGGSNGGVGGQLTKQGNGTLTLTGVNTYTGPTVVNGGTLAVDGSIVASSGATVNGGGTLSGTGMVGDVDVNGGRLAPGSAGGVGTLSVLGNLTFTAASTYMVQISRGSASRTDVGGVAALGGAAVNASFLPGAYVARQYTILDATGGIVGAFGGVVNTNLPHSFVTSLSYDANDVYLNLKLGVPNFGGGLSVNQGGVANALVNSFNTTGGIPLVFGTLTPAGLTQISGEVATGTQQTTFDAMGMFMGFMSDPNSAGRRDSQPAPSGRMSYADESASRTGRIEDAYAAFRKASLPETLDSRWSVWGAGFGGSQTATGDTALGSGTTTSRIAGGVAGADYRFSPFTTGGFALAGGGTGFSVANGGTGRSDLFQAGAFLRHSSGPAYVVGTAAYGWQDVTTDRTVTVAGLDQLRGSFNVNALSGRLEAGYRFAMPWMGFTPYAAGQFVSYRSSAYAEQAIIGANTFALAYAARDVTDPQTELGFRTDKSLALEAGQLTLRSRIAWSHDYNTARAVSTAFEALPGSGFAVNGARPAADSALTTAAAELDFRNGWSLAGSFEGKFSATTTSYAGKGGVRYSW
jgi:autotransporter-associated beta strand protein